MNAIDTKMIDLAQFKSVRGTVRVNESMSAHTSWKVGGPARYFFEPADEADIASFLAELDLDIPVLWIGLGSNLLVRDGGYPGAVIAGHRGLRDLVMTDQGVSAQSGVSCARLSRFANKHCLTGAEFFSGIPGTVGGALRMNAGAFGSETWQHVQKVRLIDRSGKISEESADRFSADYRQVNLDQGRWFTGATFQFEQSEGGNGVAVVRSLLEERGKRQPIGQASAGSVFKNPPGDFAARLIESAGLKGVRSGGASVSLQHANFIVNDQSASAEDIETLITRIQQAVYQYSEIRLETEVRIVGEQR